MVQVGKKRAIKFWKYYKEWYETYKYGDVRDVTYQRYILTGKQIKKLAPDLMLDKITRADIQKLINAYGQTHEKVTVRNFYRLLDTSNFLAFSEVLKMPHTGELKELYNISEWVDKFD